MKMLIYSQRTEMFIHYKNKTVYLPWNLWGRDAAANKIK